MNLGDGHGEYCVRVCTGSLVTIERGSPKDTQHWGTVLFFWSSGYSVLDKMVKDDKKKRKRRSRNGCSTGCRTCF